MEGFFHRLGGGKPLGFGSVQLDVDVPRAELRGGVYDADAERRALCEAIRAAGLPALWKSDRVRRGEKRLGRDKLRERARLILEFCAGIPETEK